MAKGCLFTLGVLQWCGPAVHLLKTPGKSDVAVEVQRSALCSGADMDGGGGGSPVGGVRSREEF